MACTCRRQCIRKRPWRSPCTGFEFERPESMVSTTNTDDTDVRGMVDGLIAVIGLVAVEQTL